MISTNGSTVAGLKKCIPMTRSGLGVTAASFMIGIEDVLLVSSESGLTTLPKAAVRRLGVLILDRGLGDQVALGEVVQRVGEPDPVGNGVAFVFRRLPLRTALSEKRWRPERPRRRPGSPLVRRLRSRCGRSLPRCLHP